MKGWRHLAGSVAAALLASTPVAAIEPYQQDYKVYWYGIPVGEASIRVSELDEARYRFEMQVRDNIPLYVLKADSAAVFRIAQGELIPEQAWQKGEAEGERYDVKYRYKEGQMTAIDGLDKAVELDPALIDYVTFVAKLAFDFSRSTGMQQYTVVNEQGKVRQHQFTIASNSTIPGQPTVYHVTELDARDKTEMAIVADRGVIREFTKYRKDKKKLEFQPR